jgi:hypothetical protein
MFTLSLIFGPSCDLCVFRQPTPLAQLDANRPVTAMIVVQFWWKCAATPPSVQGAPLPGSLIGCNATAIQVASRTDTTLKMLRCGAVWDWWSPPHFAGCM